MIHTARIDSYLADGLVRLTLEIAGENLPLLCRHDITEAQQQEFHAQPGQLVPLLVTVVADGEVPYLAAPDASFSVVEAGGVSTAKLQPDRVASGGRVADYPSHDTIRLDGTLSVAVRLTGAQQSTDFRRGSWLRAEGNVLVSIPGDDHDESGLRQP